MSTRVCKTCNKEKPLNPGNFYFRRTREYFPLHCIPCSRAKQNAKYANDPEFRMKTKARNSTVEYRERKNELRRQHYATDSDYREKQNAKNKEQWANNPELRNRQKRLKNTPEYREKNNRRRREKRLSNPELRETENAQRRERYANDPEYREGLLEQQRNKRRGGPEVRDRDRERWDNDPEYRKRKLKRQKGKYDNDPVYREKRLAREKRPEIKARKNARNKDRWANNPAFRESQLAKQRERYHGDPKFREQHENYGLEKRYGITMEERDRMAIKQGGVCAICHQSRKLVVDHNHSSNQGRGLLCKNCNFAIGFLADDPQVLQSAIEYLDSPRMSRNPLNKSGRDFSGGYRGSYRGNFLLLGAVSPSFRPPISLRRVRCGFERPVWRPPDGFGPTAPTSAGQLTLRRQQVAQSK